MSIQAVEDFEWDRPKEGAEPDFWVVEKHRPPESEPDEGLRENPMALVFPPPWSDEKLAKELRKAKRRPYADGWEQKSLAARVDMLEAIRNFHWVFIDDIVTANKCLSMGRNSFRYRDPKNPRVMRAIIELMEGAPLAVPRLTQAGGGGGLGLLVTGPSGVGKSSMKDRVVKHIGGYGRIHLSLNGKPARWPQLGVIAVNVESTWVETLKRIIDEADRQRGVRIHAYSSRSTRKDLNKLVGLALSAGFCPLLVVDEIQRLAKLTDHAAKEILEGMVNLMENFGIPVLLIGTVRVRNLFRLYNTELSKFANGGTREIGALELGDPTTSEFIAALKRFSVSLTPISYCEDFERQLMAQTMGVRRFMVEYVYCVLERHAQDESVVVDAKLLEGIAQEEMKDFQPALSVLRKEKLGMKLSDVDYERYEDRLVDADRRRAQSRAEVRAQAEWNSLAANRRSDLMTAADYLAGEERRNAAELEIDREADEAERVAAAESSAAAGTEAAPPKRPRGRPRKDVASPLDKAKTLVAKATKVVNIATRRAAKPAPREGTDPSDIR